MVFSDRKEAGRLLGEFLKGKVSESAIVLGIPRGGVVVAKEVAKLLGLPMSVLVVRKLGVPYEPELAFGAVDPDGEVYLDYSTVNHFSLDKETIDKVVQQELEKIREREKRFLPPQGLSVEGREVLMVDDGIATGYTLIAGASYLKRKGAKRVIIGVPVCPQESVSRLKAYADEVYCLYQVKEGPFAVGMFYRDFRQVEDQEVEEILKDGVL